MSKPAAECRQIVERLTGDFYQLSAKLNEITTGAAGTSRTVGQILDAQERKAKSLFRDAATPHRGHVLAVPRPRGTPGGGKRAPDAQRSTSFGRTGRTLRQQHCIHGSAAPIARLEPRQMTWVDSTGRRHPDGAPAICADTADLSGYTGHVHVMDKRHFQKVDLDYPPEWPGPFGTPRTPELRASTEVEPFAIVEVTSADFPHPLGNYDI
ncbi:hypothetical protein NLM24_31660 [Nocardia zapadnayensis]|uniref:hypothetical protein n=1 Tax=Nocardia rhamnosiphila TaxID=426716 RepID=UPI002247EDE1|nr:hypothetical protein [Nocardia zapadnayensis]MCX0275166.1 hypothetical protein [Nocardia zapadnayensis]